jgi:hypothetical protein
VKWSEQCARCGRRLHPRVACRPALSDAALRKRNARAMEESVDREARRHQDRGFGLALALCEREQSNPSVYASVMQAYGLTMRMAREAGLEEFDLAPLRVLARELRGRRR